MEWTSIPKEGGGGERETMESQISLKALYVPRNRDVVDCTVPCTLWCTDFDNFIILTWTVKNKNLHRTQLSKAFFSVLDPFWIHFVSEFPKNGNKAYYLLLFIS